MPELSQLDLKLSFAGACAARKNVEDQLGPVDDPATNLSLNVPLLRRREVLIENHDLGLELLRNRFQLAQLPGTNQICGIVLLTLLDESPDDGSARGCSQRCQFVQ